MNIFNTPLTSLKGVGLKRAEALSELGINSIYDLITFLPSGYEDRRSFTDISEVYDGEEVCLKAYVKSGVKTIRVRPNLTISNCIVYDETGEIMVVWYNQRFVEKQLTKDKQYSFYGKIKKGKSRLELVSPAFEDVNKEGYAGKIMPVYPLLSKIPQKTFLSIMAEAVKYSEKMIVSTLPLCVEEKYNIQKIGESVKNIHFPDNELQFIESRKRFAFEEFFYFQVMLAKVGQKRIVQVLLFQMLILSGLKRGCHLF